MADDEVAAITENMVKMSPKMVRPASPIVDIYGDEEESYDVGGAINVDMQSPPHSPSNMRHDSFFNENTAMAETNESGVWNWFNYAKSTIDAGLDSAHSYLEDNPTLQGTTNMIYSVGEEAHKKLAAAGGVAGGVMNSVSSYGSVLLSSVSATKNPNPIILCIISDKHIDVSVLNAAFNNCFSKITANTYDVVSGLAAQLVGPASAIEGCRLRVQAARAQKIVGETDVAVAVESFVNEIVPGTWVEQYCMLVSDVQHEIDLHVFSQPVNVPTDLTVRSKEATPAEYALRSSGYAKSIIEVISETFPDVNIKDWYTPFVGVSNRQVLGLVSQLLVALYVQKLINTMPPAKEGEDEGDIEGELERT